MVNWSVCYGIVKELYENSIKNGNYKCSACGWDVLLWLCEQIYSVSHLTSISCC